MAVKNALADLGSSINLMPHSLFQRLWISELKPTRISIQLADRSIKYPIGVCENLLVKVSKFIFLVDNVVLEMDEDELVPVILGRPLLATARVVIDVHEGKLSLRVDTVDHDGKWAEVEEEEDSNKVQKARLLDVIKNHKGAIAWSIADIKGIYSPLCSHKILMEDEFKPSVQPQRRVNPNIKELVNKEVINLLDAGLIYPIFDSPWTITRWRVSIDYRKLNNATQKDHFPLPFIDQMLERLVGHEYYCFLDRFLRLCNAPATFQRCMTAIFHELIKDSMEVFMDDFSVFGAGIKVDKAKIKAISKLPYPMNVKVIRSFLGHAGFYRRFIKDFSQVTRPMTQLLVKDAPFNFFKECIQAFDKLKHELMQAPMMIKPDWSLPFEVMCDASDYDVGVVLGQRIDKHFKPIHYASKTMNEAQENYTTTEKELLAVIFAFNKFCQYLVLSKTIPVFSLGLKPNLGELTKAEIKDLFPKERLMAIFDKNNEPWYADYTNYLASRVLPFRSTHQEKQKFFSDLRHYFWDESFLFKQHANRIIRRWVAGYEAAQILWQCHSEPYRGHHGIATTARKVFEAGFYWPHIFRDARRLVQVCDACQRAGSISLREETPQNPWVSPVQVVPKKRGMTAMKNMKNKLIPQRTVTRWRVCIDYRKLNNATQKDHFPLPFIDQMLEHLVGHKYYYFLDEFSGYFQILIAPEDQEKTTFTCPYGTFAYKRMPFGLCHAQATF
ncbi:reverse transcriptase domain-containing protein [Tanacetum coccineum]